MTSVFLFLQDIYTHGSRRSTFGNASSWALCLLLFFSTRCCFLEPSCSTSKRLKSIDALHFPMSPTARRPPKMAWPLIFVSDYLAKKRKRTKKVRAVLKMQWSHTVEIFTELLVTWACICAHNISRFVLIEHQAPAGKRRREEETVEEEVLEMPENVENPLRCPVRLYEFYLSKWWVLF